MTNEDPWEIHRLGMGIPCRRGRVLPLSNSEVAVVKKKALTPDAIRRALGVALPTTITCDKAGGRRIHSTVCLDCGDVLGKCVAVLVFIPGRLLPKMTDKQEIACLDRASPGTCPEPVLEVLPVVWPDKRAWFAQYAGDSDTSQILFATTRGKARKIASNAAETEYTDPCLRVVRAPQFDQYASVGRAPDAALLKDGWWVNGCTLCGHGEMLSTVDVAAGEAFIVDDKVLCPECAREAGVPVNPTVVTNEEKAAAGRGLCTALGVGDCPLVIGRTNAVLERAIERAIECLAAQPAAFCPMNVDKSWPPLGEATGTWCQQTCASCTRAWLMREERSAYPRS